MSSPSQLAYIGPTAAPIGLLDLIAICADAGRIVPTDVVASRGEAPYPLLILVPAAGNISPGCKPVTGMRAA